MNRRPIPKTKSIPVSKLKKKLWQLCRQIIKARYRNSDGSYSCYTCPQVMYDGQNQLHTGHFLASSICSAAMRYDLDNLRPQCASCNVWKSGNWLAFEDHLRRDGIDVEELKRRNRETIGGQYNRDWYERQIAAYSSLLAELEEQARPRQTRAL